MHPVLFHLGPLPVRGYAVMLLAAFLVAGGVRRAEVARLGHERMPGYRWVPVGALVGAVVGAKLGMALFIPAADVGELLRRMLLLDFTGKTVVGGLLGGYAGVEIAKKIVGITRSTGDGFAVALAVAQAIGRVGCLLEGCCAGAPWGGPWAVEIGGISRHPAQLYEAALDLALAGLLWRWRDRAGPSGNLFRYYLLGYALIRFALEPLRGDPGLAWGPLTAVQWVCLAAIVGLAGWIRRATVRSSCS